MEKKFGEFLIQKGIIDANSLVKALHIQGKRNKMQLAETAIENNVLKAEQLLDILSVQETLDERFEDIALLLDYLTQDDIDALRLKQESEQQYLGEILIALKKMDKEVLNKLLNEYNAQFK